MSYRANIERLRAVRRERAVMSAEELSAETGIPAAEIMGRGRTKEIVKVRHRLMARLWFTGMTLKDIGRALYMHHTSVMYGLRMAVGEAEYAAESPGPGRTR